MDIIKITLSKKKIKRKESKCQNVTTVFGQKDINQREINYKTKLRKNKIKGAKQNNLENFFKKDLFARK